MILLTFTRSLCEFLRSGRTVGRGDQLQRNEITTFASWAKQLLRRYNAPIPDSTGTFEQEREALAEELRCLIDTHQLGKLYDVVFIDEVQDFRRFELEIIREVAGRITAAGDFRQRIYDHQEGIPTVKEMIGDIVELQNHYRIGRKICELADQICAPKRGGPRLVDNCNYPERTRPSSVVTQVFSNFAEQCEACIARIYQQRRYIVDETIAVLFRTGEQRDQFWARLQTEQDLSAVSVIQRSNSYRAFQGVHLVQVMTVHAAKGLEFRAVHMLGCDEYNQRRLEIPFTAVTRAKSEVVLYYYGALPGFLHPPRDILPKFVDIF